MKLTDWIDGDINPVRVGVYQRNYGNNIWFCKWDGKKWMTWNALIDDAFKSKAESPYQDLPWRGLAEEPK